MNEYTIVCVIIAMVSFVIAVCTPIVKNTKEAAQRTIENTRAMTELTMTIKALAEKLATLEANNLEAHHEIAEKQSAQEIKINEHEKRLFALEYDKRASAHADDLK